METLSLRIPDIKYLTAMICSGYMVICIVLLPGYLIWDTPFLIGMMMLPFMLQIEKGTLSNRFLLPALLFSVLAIAVPVRSTLFFMLLLTTLLLFENLVGKLSLAVLLTMVIISPIFKFFSDTLSFPLRLWLSNVVAETMTFAGMPAVASGNIIILKGYQFYIDQACAGLNMLHLSLLISIFIAAHYQKKAGRTLSMIQLITMISITILLNVISNYFRIVLIVLFKIMPGQVLHDAAGLLCLCIYVILPLILLTKPITTRLQSRPLTLQTKPKISPSVVFLHIGFLISMSYLAFQPKNNNHTTDGQQLTLSGFRKSKVGDVIKLQSDEALIYLKPTPFYAPEHNPMICWKGSGYEFSFIRKQNINGITVYTGTLQKGKEKIYSSWWFDNGSLKTINQLSWRWHSGLSNSSFYLVNVNTARASDLHAMTAKLLASSFISQKINPAQKYTLKTK
ncbi:hypothetical protein PBAL39_08686 [Pedobacter sp. BAL39]|uniref:exosortase N n=1 Tax=Pedobacter sp. BAL39 TaxID=391596 RepID=UPI000155AF69|nr:exosortase N [Pedobacter sp. BAL39]EDM34350.1 hypothetical protein PBAL39_08686 [Pedobacter sp. BAL39]